MTVKTSTGKRTGANATPVEGAMVATLRQLPPDYLAALPSLPDLHLVRGQMRRQPITTPVSGWSRSKSWAALPLQPSLAR